MERVWRHVGECGWFWAWSVVGALAALGIISALSFITLIPAFGIGWAIDAGGHPPGRTAFGAVSGAGLLVLSVPYINRNGPDPHTWGAAGLLFLAGGMIAFAIAKHRAGLSGTAA